MEGKAGFLKDEKAKPSAMRLMSFIALAAAVLFGWLTIKSGADNFAGVYITVGFLLAAFAPKALQKYIENLGMRGMRGPKNG